MTGTFLFHAKIMATATYSPNVQYLYARETNLHVKERSHGWAQVFKRRYGACFVLELWSLSNCLWTVTALVSDKQTKEL